MINKKYFLAFIGGLCIVPAVFCMKKESSRKQPKNTEAGKSKNEDKKTVTPDELMKVILLQKQTKKNNNTNNSPGSGQKVNS